MIAAFSIILIALTGLEILIIRAGSGIEPRIRVLAAAGEIQAGALIQGGMLEERWALSDPGSRALKESDKELYTGYRAADRLYAGEILYEDDLVPPGKISSILLDDPGNVLMALDLKGDQANGWWVEVNSRVDVLYVSALDKKTIERMEWIRVAGLLDETGSPVPAPGGDRNAFPPKYISLEVTPGQAILLAGAKTSGKVELAVRGEGGNRQQNQN
ncbi:MAG TPA: hypothetical protein DD727_07315 [Clostridiales bacterium]|nr:hypothetical protein [Clostridiales bacterium]